ncbi:MAG TPA: hypothetical protein VKG44_08510 [Candidatus Baltobacteraceae bacterium]|nr:hypothetical protein [Candidatus Baltobacteraceae bacterium]
MGLVVAGLSQTSDVRALSEALRAAGLSVEPLQVFGAGDDADRPLARGLIGSELIEGDPGMMVPGINKGDGGAAQFFPDETVADELSELNIPDSELDNYLEALDNGKSVVAYVADAGNVERVTEIFKSAAIINVRNY